MSSPKSKIQKGKDLENHLADLIVKKGLDDKATRSIGSGSGTREKADISTSLQILGRNAGFECKNYKNAHIQDWWKQAQKLETLDREPVLVYKLGGEGYGETKAVIYLETLLDLVKSQNDAPKHTGIPQSDRWIVKSAIEALKKVLKVLEKYGE